jgi:hypothetical protein
MELVDGVRFGRHRVAEADLRAAIDTARAAAAALENHFASLEEQLEAAS